MENNIQLVQVIASLIGGGLAGACANIWFNRSKDQRDISLRMITEFFAIYRDVGIAKGILSSPEDLSPSDYEKLAIINRVGDWFHLVAGLFITNTLDKNLLRHAGVVDEMKRFRNNIAVASAKSEALRYAWSAWPNLENFSDR